MKDRSKKYHDRVARRYDAIYDDPYWAFHDELTWRLVKAHLPRDLSARCCDLGCGTGKWGLKLLKSGFATTFLDHSAAMVEQVRHKLEGSPRAKKATLVVGDIVAMPDLPDDASRALQFTRSAPGLHTALVGMKTPEHVTRNLKLLETPPLTKEALDDCLDTILHQGDSA